MAEEIKLPERLLAPIKNFLEKEIVKWKKTKRKLEKSDPFRDSARASDNSLEEDVDEQVGHWDVEAKAGFAARQVVQLRKALTRLKIGKYGLCEKCGKMIDTDRLAVRPETTLCIKCAKERES